MKGTNIKKLLFIIALILTGSVVARVFLLPHRNDKPAAWLITNMPHLTYVKVVCGPVVLANEENLYWNAKVNPDSTPNAHIVGLFEVSGGPQEDIQVVLAEASEFEKWKNRHEARTLYFGDQIASGKFDVCVPEPGTYILSFRNTSSAVT